MTAPATPALLAGVVGRTNLPVQVETTLTGCAEYGASLNQD